MSNLRPVENPSEAQLVWWAANNGLLGITPDKIRKLSPSQQTIFLLRELYAASVAKWKREAKPLTADQITISLLYHPF